MDKINALVFEGGAFYGVAYLGAVDELSKRLDFSQIKYFCGNSVGSVFAFALAIGLTIQQIEKVFYQFRRYALLKIPFIALKMPWNILMNYGLVNNDILREGIMMLLHEAYPYRTDIKFKDIEHDLIIPFTILNDSFYIVGSKYSTPNMSVIDAVTFSCCGNIAFTPSQVKLKSQNKNLTIVDGGISNLNYPVAIFTNRTDPAYILNLLDNDNTKDFYEQYGGNWSDLYRIIKNEDDNKLIGLRFGNPNRYIDMKINNIFVYLWVFTNVTIQSLYSGIGNDTRYSIWIDTGNAISFDPTNIFIPVRANRLINAGRHAVANFKFLQ